MKMPVTPLYRTVPNAGVAHSGRCAARPTVADGGGVTRCDSRSHAREVGERLAGYDYQRDASDITERRVGIEPPVGEEENGEDSDEERDDG